eukprot:954343-Rhodomonas_salina.1
MEVGRLVKLFKIFINPADSTGQDTMQLSLAYVSWFDREHHPALDPESSETDTAMGMPGITLKLFKP